MRILILPLILCAFLSSAFAADTKEIPKRTLLLEILDIPAEEQQGEGTFAYSKNRKRIVSLVLNDIMILANPEERAALEAKGFKPTGVMESDDTRQLYRRGLYGPSMKLDSVYHSYAQIKERAAKLMASRPELMTRFQIGETSQFKQPIYAYRLSNDAHQVHDRPGVLFTGCHHADEIMGAEIVLALMEKLIAGYDEDEQVTRWLDTLEIYLVPVLNVDGHNIVTSGHDPRWRKNVRDVNGDGITGVYPEGVDVNRGYSFNWAMGGSNDPDGVSYRGPYPFSQAENRAMRALADKHQLLLSVSYHSQGEVIFYPWVWGKMKSPDHKVIERIAADVAGQITQMDGSGTYAIAPGGPSSQSYPWFYGRRGVMDMIIETGRGSHVFPPAVVPGIVAENLKGATRLIEHAYGPGLSVKVTDAVTGHPLKAQVWLPRVDNESIDRRHSDEQFGRARRLLDPRNYHLVVSLEGYATEVRTEVAVGDEGWTELEIKLSPES